MEVKTFKTDLTYCCKKFTKEGKILSAFGDNLSVVDGQFVAEGNHLDPLEMFALVKGYVPTKTMLTVYHDKWQRPDTKEWRELWTPHHTAFNLSMVDVLEEQAQISRADLYQFLDGFDNLFSETKNEFYTLGVYIREKFLPEGARTEALRNLGYQFNAMQGRKPLRLFVIHSMKGKTSIVEAECYVLTPMDDSSILYLPKGEFRCLVAAPEILFEKKSNGTLGPAVYQGSAFYETLEMAQTKAEQSIRSSFERSLRKQGTAYTEEEVQAKVALVKIITL